MSTTTATPRAPRALPPLMQLSDAAAERLRKLYAGGQEGKLLRIAAHRQPQALRILLCSTPHPALLELAARHDAKLLSRPPPPSKLRSLLLQRAPPALRGAA